MSNSFFVFLPSNVADYPENQPNKFRVRLPKPIIFNGSWVCGLHSISYPLSWPATIGTLDDQWINIHYKGRGGQQQIIHLPIPKATFTNVEKLEQFLESILKYHAEKIGSISDGNFIDEAEILTERKRRQVLRSPTPVEELPLRSPPRIDEDLRSPSPIEDNNSKKAKLQDPPPATGASPASLDNQTKNAEGKSPSSTLPSPSALSTPTNQNQAGAFLSKLGMPRASEEEKNTAQRVIETITGAKKEEKKEEKTQSAPTPISAPEAQKETALPTLPPTNQTRPSSPPARVEEPLSSPPRITEDESTNKSGKFLEKLGLSRAKEGQTNVENIGLARPKENEGNIAGEILKTIGAPRPKEDEPNLAGRILANIGLERPKDGETNMAGKFLSKMGMPRPSKEETNRSHAFLKTLGLSGERGKSASNFLLKILGKSPRDKADLESIKNAIKSVHLKYLDEFDRITAVIEDPKISHLSFSAQLGYVLGWQDPERVVDKEIAKYNSDLSGGFSSFAVYTKGLTEQMIIGNSYSSLLRVVSISGTKPGEYTEKIYDTPIYARVLPREVNEIEIELRTLDGRLLPFAYGTTLIVLIFKRVINF